MSENHYLIPRPKRTLLDRHIFRLAVFLGGSKAVLARLLAQNPNTLLLVIDNESEITDFREKYPNLRCRTIAMGAGQTTATLHRSAISTVKEASLLTSNTQMSRGYGARPKNADAAAELLINSPDFEELLASLPDEAIVRTLGKPKSIRVDFYGSLAGSGFGGGHRRIAEAIFKSLLKLERGIDFRADALGPIVYSSISPRARQNAASNLLSVLKKVTDPICGHELISERDLLHELPPFLDDSERRDKFLLFDAVAKGCRDLERLLAVIETNYQQDSAFGGVVSSEVDFMEGLAQRDLAPQIAENLLPSLKSTFEQTGPDPELVDELRWDDVSVQQLREPIDKVIERSEAVELPSLLQSLEKPPASYRLRLFIRTARGSEFNVEELRNDFSRTPDTLDEFVYRLQLLETFRTVVEPELEAARDDIAELQAAVETTREQLVKISSALQKTFTLLRGGKLNRFHEYARSLREDSDRLHLRIAQRDTLLRALDATSHELAHHREVVKRIETLLDRIVPRGSLVRTPTYVACEQISNAFPRLMRLLTLADSERLDALCDLAVTINSEGLAHIAHAASDRDEDLARAIVRGAYDVESPSHGAWHNQHVPRPIYALPPMTSSSEENLRAAITKEDPGARVVFCDTLAFGATVMRLRLRRFTHVGGLYRGITGVDLNDAMRDPLAALNSVDAFAGIEHFGGRTEGDRVVFPLDEVDEADSSR